MGPEAKTSAASVSIVRWRVWMELPRGFIVLVLSLLTGELIKSWLHQPIPGSVLGLFLLLICFRLRLIAPQLVEQASKGFCFGRHEFDGHLRRLLLAMFAAADLVGEPGESFSPLMASGEHETNRAIPAPPRMQTKDICIVRSRGFDILYADHDTVYLSQHFFAPDVPFSLALNHPGFLCSASPLLARIRRSHNLAWMRDPGLLIASTPPC